MTKHRLPQDVIEQDHVLEREWEQSALALAELCWHWTLDRTNGERVTEYEFARQVRRAESEVRQYALAYQNHREAAAQGTRRTFEACLEWAAFRLETEAATQAVADARGIAFSIARQEHTNEVRRVREIAPRRAEARGTSVATEAPLVAARIARRAKRGS
ncbi:MAG TPA: hypothetical protein VKT83_05540 [bacterium]|nr:hypothetical protein [bacterium]